MQADVSYSIRSSATGALVMQRVSRCREIVSSGSMGSPTQTRKPTSAYRSQLSAFEATDEATQRVLKRRA